jgi:hypothetical protein
MAVPVTTLLYLKVDAGERWSISLLFTAGLWLLIYGLFLKDCSGTGWDSCCWGINAPFREGCPCRNRLRIAGRSKV